MRIAISFDYDSAAGLRMSFNHRYIPPDADIRGTDLLLDVLAKHNVSATFAVVGNAARGGNPPEHSPGQIRRIHSCGHEIASHSMWHRYLPSLSDEQLFVELAESKATLEECIGQPVTGFIPPFNRPMQFLSKGSFSFSEGFGMMGRGRARQSIPSLARALTIAGYRWCRVSFENKLAFLTRQPALRPLGHQPFLHDSLVLLPIHVSGYDDKAREMIRRCLEAGVENLTLYSHPNTAIFPGRESAEALDGLLETFRSEVSYGKIQFCTMKDLELITRSAAPVPAGESPNSAAFAYAIAPIPRPAASSQAPPAVVVPVTIMVPCRNEKKGIAKLLDSILAQDMTGLDWEVIIADGMSDDGTRDTIEAYRKKQPRLRLIDNPGRIVSTGLNAALREAKGEIILRMDAHTEYAPDYVRACVDTLVRTGAQNVGGPARTRSEGLIQRAIALAYKNPFACGGAKFHLAEFEGFVDTVPYGCWRKSTLSDLGGFDESLVRNQDDELNLRLSRSGGRIYQSPQIKSWYHPRDRLSRLYRQYFQYGFWKVAVIRKHRVPASIRHLVPVTFVLANLVFLLNAVVSLALHHELAWKVGNSLWAAMMGLYFLIGFTSAARTAVLTSWSMLPLMPFVFLIYHLSYGFGFLCGLLYWPFVRMDKAGPPAKLFTQLSR